MIDLIPDKTLQLVQSWASANAPHALRIGLILGVALGLLRAIRVLVPRIREHLANRQESIEDAKRIQTIMRVAHYLLSLTTLGVAALLVMSEIGISLAPILGAAGIVGIALGFGAQTLVKDYVSGFLLLIENQIRVGDMIEVGGKSGIVEEVSLRFVRLRDYGGNVHFIPNGAISVITNQSLGFAFAVLDIGITYGSDIDAAMGIMRKVDEEMRANKEQAARILGPLEIAGVDQWADSSLVIRGRIQVKPLEQWNVRREYLKRLKLAFDASGLEIPLPRMKLVQ